MKESGRFRWSRLVKPAALLSLVVISCVVASLVYRNLKDSRETAVPPPIESEPGQAAENIRHLEFRSGRLAVEIEADGSTAGEDGNVTFTGNVRFVIHGEPAGGKTELSAATIVYDPEQEVFRVSGPVEAIYGRLHVQAPFPGALGKTNKRKVAESAIYDASRHEIRLETGFEARIASAEDGPGILISGRSLEYDMKTAAGVVSGLVRFSAGSLVARSDVGGFSFKPGGEGLAKVNLAGSVRFEFKEATPNGFNESVLEAEKAELTIGAETGLTSAINASAGVKLMRLVAEGGSQILDCSAFRMDFDRRGVPADFEAVGGVVARLSLESRPEAILSGEKISYSAERASFVVTDQARIEDEDFVLEAGNVVFQSGEGQAEATDGVKGYVKSRMDGCQTGIFRPANPVFFLGGKALIRSEAKSLKLLDMIKIWQENAWLTGSELEFMAGSRDFSSEGSLEAFFISGEDEKVEIKAGDMIYSASGRRARLGGGVEMKIPAFSASSRKAMISFSAESPEMEGLKLEGEVRLLCGKFKGECNLATFEPESRLLTLEGEPSLKGPEADFLRGDKLTFDISNDRIFVERRGKGRSLIILKLER